MPNISQFGIVLMTFADNLDPDEAQQNVEPHLRSKLLDTQVKILAFLYEH